MRSIDDLDKQPQIFEGGKGPGRRTAQKLMGGGGGVARRVAQCRRKDVQIYCTYSSGGCGRRD